MHYAKISLSHIYDCLSDYTYYLSDDYVYSKDDTGSFTLQDNYDYDILPLSEVY